ncbi:hypothetical protein D5086_008159 [Populus alba]|uniref:Uncharacterized protein n=1 Tax=Populus alba TaxID=43335 RepID=A0ACC4CF11_POPAL
MFRYRPPIFQACALEHSFAPHIPCLLRRFKFVDKYRSANSMPCNYRRPLSEQPEKSNSANCFVSLLDQRWVLTN